MIPCDADKRLASLNRALRFGHRKALESAEIAAMYQHSTLSAIARKMRCSIPAVVWHLERAGVQRRKRGPIPVAKCWCGRETHKIDAGNGYMGGTLCRFHRKVQVARAKAEWRKRRAA